MSIPDNSFNLLHGGSHITAGRLGHHVVTIHATVLVHLCNFTLPCVATINNNHLAKIIEYTNAMN